MGILYQATKFRSTNIVATAFWVLSSKILIPANIFYNVYYGSAFVGSGLILRNDGNFVNSLVQLLASLNVSNEYVCYVCMLCFVVGYCVVCVGNS